MTFYGDTVSIAATSSGVAGTITVPMGAKLWGLNLAATGTAGVSCISVGIKWTGFAECKYTPNMVIVPTTNGNAVGTCKSPLVSLKRLPAVSQTNTVTITVTTTGNQTVQVGLMWAAV